MNKLTKILPVLAIALALFSFMAPQKKKQELIVKKGILSINGKAINPNWNLADAKAGLGEPDRYRDGYNKTHTYDGLGIVLFEKVNNKVPSGTINEVQCFLQNAPEPNEVTPKGYNTHKVKIDKLTITRDLTSGMMFEKLKNWVKTDSYTPHSYRMQFEKKLYIYFQFDIAETSLIKISIGPVKE